MARVLVSGASGLIGSALVPALKTSGAQVVRLERPNAAKKARTGDEEEAIVWDPAQPLAAEAVSGFDSVIHLAGETIMGRWTDAKKAKIRKDRKSTRLNSSHTSVSRMPSSA
jgi:hypothetical protein